MVPYRFSDFTVTDIFIVTVPPVIRRGPQSREVSEGHDVEFTCHVFGTPHPVTTILWKKDDQFIKLVIFFVFKLSMKL